MNAETNIERYVAAWKTTASLARMPVIWVPFVLMTGLKIAPLVLVYFFWHPLVSSFATPLVRSLFGEEAIHYPAHILRLPGIFTAIDIAATMTLGFTLIGWSVIMMIGRAGGRRGLEWRRAAPALILVPSFFVLGLLFAAGVKGIPAYFVQASRSVSNEKFQMLLFLCGIGASLTIRGVLAYAPPYLVQSRGRVSPAIGKSWQYAVRSPWLTTMIVLTAAVVQVPLEYLVWTPGRLLQTWGPSSVFAVLLSGAILESLGLFYLCASATSIVVDEERRGAK